jgi:hypothetical protein
VAVSLFLFGGTAKNSMYWFVLFLLFNLIFFLFLFIFFYLFIFFFILYFFLFFLLLVFVGCVQIYCSIVDVFVSAVHPCKFLLVLVSLFHLPSSPLIFFFKLFSYHYYFFSSSFFSSYFFKLFFLICIFISFRKYI